MSRRPRRNHTPGFKAKGALAAIKGDRTLDQLAEQFDVDHNQITSWKAQLEEGQPKCSVRAADRRRAAGHRREVLHAKIGELTTENDFWKERSAKQVC